jgi:proteasome assembly chaperone (PAC2) family protein
MSEEQFQTPDATETVVSEKEFLNPMTIGDLTGQSHLKDWVINYVGRHPSNQGSEDITVEKIVEVFSQEFPEFLLVVAEENWVRGYQQALVDVDVGEEIANRESPNV